MENSGGCPGELDEHANGDFIGTRQILVKAGHDPGDKKSCFMFEENAAYTSVQAKDQARLELVHSVVGAGHFDNPVEHIQYHILPFGERQNV